MDRKASPARKAESVDIIRATTRRFVAPFSGASPNRRRSSSLPMQPVETKGSPSTDLSTVQDIKRPSSRSDRLSLLSSSPSAGMAEGIPVPSGSLSRNRSPDIIAAMATSAAAASSNSSGCEMFEGLTYCGHCTVDAPISQNEANRAMNMLRKQPQESMLVSLSVPTTCDGAIRLIDVESGLELTNYPVRSVLFCARGTRENDARDCMAFTVAHRQGSGVFYCHVLKADEEDKIRRMLRLLGTAFKDNTHRQRVLAATEGRLKSLDYKFEVFLDFGEEDSKGQYTSVARDKDLFKMRQNIPKQVALMITQPQDVPLIIMRCFGVLLAAGRDVEQSDMNPIDMIQMKQADDGKSYYITGLWDPTDSNHTQLNQETAKGEKIFLTVAADLVFAGIADPVRFVRTVKVRVFKKNERFWISTRQPCTELFHMRLRETTPSSSATPTDDQSPTPASQGSSSSTVSRERTRYEVEWLEAVAQAGSASPSLSVTTAVDASHSAGPVSPATVTGSSAPLVKHELSVPGLSKSDRRTKSSTEDVSAAENSDSDEADASIEDDEPLASGSGHVDRQWTEAELENWSDLLSRWDGSGRPKQLTALIRKRGVPEPLRGRVWEMLAGLTAHTDLLENFRVLVTKESPQERIIQEDISRTYPAHEYFRDNGEGQQALYKISKAYSIYDKEVGYCQGLSFLIAALVLHMPMEQAFGCLVHLMYNYEVRDLFRNEFGRLKLNLFQLQKLIEDTMPDLAQHMAVQGVETHMFASQWFLTLYSSKFPLHAVFRILDLFLSEGSTVIFQVGIALLKIAKAELLALDFENILKYFRVQLPKKFSTDEQAALLLRQVVSTKISQRKLKKFSKDYALYLEAEALNSDPVERMKKLTSEQRNTIHRLEQENDVLATELVTSKVHLRTEMDELERKVDRLSKQLRGKEDELQKVVEHREQTNEEFAQFKELYHQSLLEMNEMRERTRTEQAEQKLLAKDMDERHQREQHDLHQELIEVKARLSKVLTRRQVSKTESLALERSEGTASACAAAAAAAAAAAGGGGGGDTSVADAPAEDVATSADTACTGGDSLAPTVTTTGTTTTGSDADRDGSLELARNGSDQGYSFDEFSLSAEQRCRELEVQMAHYKLQLVEAECKIQDLQHVLKNSTPDTDHESSTVNRWLAKLR